MPDIWLDVDIELQEVPVNVAPLLDDTDFKTIETGLRHNQAGLRLFWNFITTAGLFSHTEVVPSGTAESGTGTAGAYDWTDQGHGMYTISMPVTGGASINNNQEGTGWFSGQCTGVLPWIGPRIGFRAAGINDKLIDSAYSATRGLAGTALPDAAADAAGGLPISDAGGLDLDSKLANTNEVTAARMGALTDWIDGGRLDLILDARASQTDVTAILADTNEVQQKLAGTGTVTMAALTVNGATTLTGNVALAAGMTITQSTTNGHGISVTGNGTGDGIMTIGGLTGDGIHTSGGGTSGRGIHALAGNGNSEGIYAVGQGIGAGFYAQGGSTGHGAYIRGGDTSGDGIHAHATAGTSSGIAAEAHGTGVGFLADKFTVTGDLTAGGVVFDDVIAKLDSMIVSDTGTGTTYQFEASALDGVWDAVLTRHLTSGSTGSALNAAGSAGDPWATSLPGAYGDGTAGFVVGQLRDLIQESGGTAGLYEFTSLALQNAPTGGSAPTAAQIRAEIDSNSTQLAAIVADTNELQTDWVNGGRLDLILDDILLDTGTTLPATLTDIKGATFNGATDSLEAIRNQGDSAWATATGFSTHSAADVWSSVTRTLTAGTNIQLPANGLANVTTWTVAITGNITGNLSGSVGSVTGAVGSVTGNVGGSVASVTGAINTAAGTITTLDALDTAQDTQHGTTQTAVATKPTLAQILAGGDVDGYTLEETLKLCLAALSGKLSGAATTTVTIRAADDSANRITATVDADGNRTAITLNAAG